MSPFALPEKGSYVTLHLTSGAALCGTLMGTLTNPNGDVLVELHDAEEADRFDHMADMKHVIAVTLHS